LFTKTGLIEQNSANSTVVVGKPAYFLMLDNAIVLNMDTIFDNDRLNLIPSSSLQSYLTGLASKFIPHQLPPLF